MKGRVLWFDPARGLGLIAPADILASVLVRQRELERTGLASLARGQDVEFELSRDRRRGTLYARKVRPV